MHKRKNVKRILAYIYMPVFLSLIGFLLVFICLSPYISAVYSVMSILSGETTETTVDVSGVPDFKLENAQNHFSVSLSISAIVASRGTIEGEVSAFRR